MKCSEAVDASSVVLVLVLPCLALPCPAVLSHPLHPASSSWQSGGLSFSRDAAF